VASKVAALLDAFLPSSQELSLNELSQRTGMPVTTTYRLTTELVEWGGLERGPNGRYRVATRLWEIGSLAYRHTSALEVALPFMQDLHESTHENVQLAVLNGLEALYIERIGNRRSGAVRTRRNGRLPLHATGVGKVLLAHAPDDVVQARLRGGLRRYTPNTIVEPAALLRTLAAIRHTGVAYAREELTLGSVSVAAPLFDTRGNAIAAISLVIRSADIDLCRLAPAVRTAAISASRELRIRTCDLRLPAVAVRSADSSA